MLMSTCSIAFFKARHCAILITSLDVSNRSSLYVSLFVFFFFQAEDGIRDYKVTGVQTCALPICLASVGDAEHLAQLGDRVAADTLREVTGLVAVGARAAGANLHGAGRAAGRSEERRVGKECRSRWSPYH